METQSASSNKAKGLICLLHLCGAGTALCMLWLSFPFYHDDAYISLRYALNWLHGDGLRWNVGEPPVEGYSNFLHVVLAAALGGLGFDLVVASRAIGVGAYVGLLWVVASHVRLPQLIRSRDGSLAHVNAALAFWLVATAVPLTGWVFGGLETVLAAFLLALAVAATLALAHRPSYHCAVVVGMAFAALLLTRPDGLPYAVLSFLFLAMYSYKNARLRVPLLLAAAILLLVMLPYHSWRLSYFGEWLPNTYYAKVYGIPREWLLAGGAFYMLQYWLMFPFLAVMISVLALLLLPKRALGLMELYLLAMFFAGMAAILWVGGDHMPHLRMAAPLCVIAGLIMHRFGGIMLAKGKAGWLRDIASAMLLFIPAQAGYLQEIGLSSGALSGQVAAQEVGQWPHNSTIAINPAGALPYLTPQHRYVDMLGLNDHAIARRKITELIAEGQRAAGHLKGDGDSVLSRRPDYIILGMNWGADASEPMFMGDVEITQDPRFAQDYERHELWLEVPASLKEQLQRMAASESAAQQYRLKLNGQGQVRFIFYKRKA